jgi:hypothetical protein
VTQLHGVLDDLGKGELSPAYSSFIQQKILPTAVYWLTHRQYVEQEAIK